MKRVFGVLGLVAGCAVGAWAYPNGTPHYVTDLVPACASCHSVRDAGTMPELPDRRAQGELAANKHLGAIRAGAFPMYAELSPEQREALAAEVERIDREAAVELRGPGTAGPGETVEVTVSYRGGNGPVVGILLVDRPLRYQARPAQAVGWRILGVTARTEAGKGTGEWFSHRVDGAKDLNFVLLPAAPRGEEPPSGTVTFRLRAPTAGGTAPLAAVFLYGTENTDRAGFFQRPSGRILFSEPLEVRVAPGN